jgi:hypothetical protein
MVSVCKYIYQLEPVKVANHLPPFKFTCVLFFATPEVAVIAEEHYTCIHGSHVVQRSQGLEG